MAWLQNLAGKAEDLLNKIDQNAATVLHDSTTKLLDISSNIIEPFENDGNSSSIDTIEILNEKRNSLKTQSLDDTSNKATEKEEEKTDIKCDDIMSVSVDNAIEDIEIKSVSEKVTTSKIFERDIKSLSCGLSSKSDSASNNNQITDELQIKLEEKILKLELEYQEITHQMLNIQHLYSELKNENTSLKAQLERANDSVLHAQIEMEQYKARAQRILQEKEKLICFKNEDFIESNENLSVLSNYNDEIKKELEFQQQRNKELIDKNNNLNTELTELQKEIANIHNSYYKEKIILQNNILSGKKYNLMAEEECRSKIKELNTIKVELSEICKLYEIKKKEVEDLKQQIKDRHNFQLDVDVDSRIQNLTQTLMSKQTTLESVTCERNALRIQFEKLERDYSKLIQCQRSNHIYSSLIDAEEGKSQIPKLTVVSPLDVGVKRKVKHTFSTLDAISIRTGAFLRRYPVARIFVFCYMILLHIWVLIILFTYIPTR